MVLALGSLAQSMEGMSSMQEQTMTAGMGDDPGGTMTGDCPQSSDCDDAVMSCATACGGFVALASRVPSILVVTPMALVFGSPEFLRQHFSTPDPYPPRSVIPG